MKLDWKFQEQRKQQHFQIVLIRQICKNLCSCKYLMHILIWNYKENVLDNHKPLVLSGCGQAADTHIHLENIIQHLVGVTMKFNCIPLALQKELC